MSNQRRIGLLSPFFLPIAAYEKPANDLNIGLVIVTPNRIDWKRQKVQGLLWTGEAWIEDSVVLPRAHYNRFYGPKPKVVDRLEGLLGKNKVFNHITRFNKWSIHQLLAESKLKAYLPATELYTPKQLKAYVERFKQVIVKPVSGQLGTQIYLVREEAGIYYLHCGTTSPVAVFSSLRDLLVKLESFAHNDFLVQQYVTFASVQGRIFDIRFLIQKGGAGNWHVSGRLSRVALSYSYITNVSQAIVETDEILLQAFPGRHLLPTLTELSLEAARIVEASLGSLGEISVDLCLDDQERVWIIELNAKPMKSIFAHLGKGELMQEIYKQPLLYALHLAAS